MRASKDVCVIGLGKFGFTLAMELESMDHRVLGVDLDEANIRAARDVLHQVYQGDATDPTVLQQLHVADLSHVIVSVGESMEASILITLNLKELGAEQVWAKAVSVSHEKVLQKLGADLVVFPEQMAAQQLAHRLAVPGLMNYLPLGKGVMVQELEVDNWRGKTLRELDLPANYKMQVLAIRRAGESQFRFVPHASDVLYAGDTLVTIGNEEDMQKLSEV